MTRRYRETGGAFVFVMERQMFWVELYCKIRVIAMGVSIAFVIAVLLKTLFD